MSGKRRSATNPDQPQQADNVATRDRMASHGDDYARDDNRSGEGNDASHTAGPTFTREVHADGSVEPESTPHDDTQSDGGASGDGDTAATDRTG